jgi:hypothetical protein
MQHADDPAASAARLWALEVFLLSLIEVLRARGAVGDDDLFAAFDRAEVLLTGTGEAAAAGGAQDLFLSRTLAAVADLRGQLTPTKGRRPA